MEKKKRDEPIGKKRNEFAYVVGIDFGTDGCGVAYIRSVDLEGDESFIPNRIDTSADQRFEDNENPNDKSPNVLLLNKDLTFHSFGFTAMNQFIKPEKKESKNDKLLFQNFKMSLYEAGNQTPMSESWTGEKVETEKLMTMSLLAVKNYALKRLKDEFYSNSNPSEIEEASILWVLTVPAIWSPKGKFLVRSAAEKVDLSKGKNKLVLALEPECASLWIQNKDEVGRLKPGTVFIVADLGAGTDDISAHQMLENNIVKEVHMPSGGNWGSSYINAEFERLLELIGGKKHIVDFKKENPKKWVEIMLDFEKRKKRCKPKEPMIFRLNNSLNNYLEKKTHQEMKELISSAENELVKKHGTEEIKIGFDDERDIELSGEAVFKILFEPVVSNVVNHLKYLLSLEAVKSCSYIFLVGGKAQSKMLVDAISKNDAFKNIKIILPSRPHLAVVCGAVLFGLRPNAITSRISMRTYGVAVAEEYNEKDPRHIGHKVRIGEKDYVNNVFSCFVEVGQSIKNNDIIQHTLYPLHSGQEKMNVEIFESIEKKKDIFFVYDCRCKRPLESEHKCKIMENRICKSVGVGFSVKLPEKGKSPVTVSMKFGSTEIQVTADNGVAPTMKSFEFRTNCL